MKCRTLCASLRDIAESVGGYAIDFFMVQLVISSHCFPGEKHIVLSTVYA
jgi:hypothetical protein